MARSWRKGIEADGADHVSCWGGPPGGRAAVRAVSGWPAPAISEGALLYRAHLRAAGAGGLRRPVHARREPHEVAPGAHLLVLRDLRPLLGPPRLPPLPPAVQLSVQLLLQRRGRAPRPPAAGAAHPPHGGRDLPLPRARGRLHAGAAGWRRRRAPGAARPDRGAGPAPRAAAPGAVAHRPQARARLQSAAAGVP